MGGKGKKAAWGKFEMPPAGYFDTDLLAEFSAEQLDNHFEGLKLARTVEKRMRAEIAHKQKSNHSAVGRGNAARVGASHKVAPIIEQPAGGAIVPQPGFQVPIIEQPTGGAIVPQPGFQVPIIAEEAGLQVPIIAEEAGLQVPIIAEEAGLQLPIVAEEAGAAQGPTHTDVQPETDGDPDDARLMDDGMVVGISSSACKE